MGPDDTDELTTRLAGEDEQAFAELYDRFAGRLFRAARATLRNREDAEDAVQEVFAGLVRSRHQLSEVRDLTAYLFVSLRRSVSRVAQRQARQPNPSAIVEEQAVWTERDTESTHGERLHEAIQTLPSEQREVISLRIDGELTFGQIAQVTGISPNTVASRYRYALEKLRLRLCEPGSMGTDGPEVTEDRANGTIRASGQSR